MNLDTLFNLSDLISNQSLSYSTQLYPLELRMVLPVWTPSPTSPPLLPSTLEFGWAGVEVFSLFFTTQAPIHGSTPAELVPMPIFRENTVNCPSSGWAHRRPHTSGQVERLRRTNSFSGRGHRERSLSRRNSSRIEEMHRERLELLIYMSVLDTFNVTLASPLFLESCSSWVAQAWSHPLLRHCCWSFLTGSVVSKLLSQVSVDSFLPSNSSAG